MPIDTIFSQLVLEDAEGRVLTREEREVLESLPRQWHAVLASLVRQDQAELSERVSQLSLRRRMWEASGGNDQRSGERAWLLEETHRQEEINSIKRRMAVRIDRSSVGKPLLKEQHCSVWANARHRKSQVYLQ